MTNLNALRDLEKRLAEAKGPDREIDAALWSLWDDRPLSDACGELRIYKRDPAEAIVYDAPPNYTASLDAAIALVERVLPDWHLCVNNSWSARLNPTALGKVGDGFANHATPALALCLACLRALIAQGEQ